MPFQIVAKPAGPACNLACSYCFYLDKPATGRMSPEVLDAFIRQRIEAEPGREVDFIWQSLKYVRLCLFVYATQPALL